MFQTASRVSSCALVLIFGTGVAANMAPRREIKKHQKHSLENLWVMSQEVFTTSINSLWFKLPFACGPQKNVLDRTVFHLHIFSYSVFFVVSKPVDWCNFSTVDCCCSTFTGLSELHKRK